KNRAAIEVAEESGFHVTPDNIVLLGAGAFPSPGAMAEKFWLTCVEVDRTTATPPEGDGSPMEEGAHLEWLPLDEAIAACAPAALEDAKPELILRRLKAHLPPQPPPPT